MIDKSYLQDILAILKGHGVSHVKMQGLEISFGHEGGILAAPAAQSIGLIGTEDPSQSIQSTIEALKKQEQSLPSDLRVENINNQESVLNWSSPDQRSFEEEPELPLTGEQPL